MMNSREVVDLVQATGQQPTINQAIGDGQHALAAAGLETPRLDAEILLRHVLGLDRAQLFARLRDPIPEDALAAYLELVAARASGTPVAW